MNGPSEGNAARRIGWIGGGMVCLGLLAWAIALKSSPSPVPIDAITPLPTTASTPKPDPALRPTSTSTTRPAPTFSPEPVLSVTSRAQTEDSLAGFEGCWGLETEDVSFEIQLEPHGSRIQGSLLLVKLCLVADELTACRIREGTLEGTRVTTDTLEIHLSILEYDDEGVARLTLNPGGATLRWEELDYPAAGLADGATRYLPPSFILVPCGGYDPQTDEEY